MKDLATGKPHRRVARSLVPRDAMGDAFGMRSERSQSEAVLAFS